MEREMNKVSLWQLLQLHAKISEDKENGCTTKTDGNQSTHLTQRKFIHASLNKDGR